MKIDWSQPIHPEKLITGAAVALAFTGSAILWYINNQNANEKQNARMDAIEARIATDERINDTWQKDEKSNLESLRTSTERLLGQTTEIRIEVAKLSAKSEAAHGVVK